MVQGYLLHPENYTKDQLKENYYAAACADCVAAYAAACAAYAAAACATACVAADRAARAEKYLKEFFELTGENRQDYIDAINKDDK